MCNAQMLTSLAQAAAGPNGGYDLADRLLQAREQAVQAGLVPPDNPSSILPPIPANLDTEAAVQAEALPAPPPRTPPPGAPGVPSLPPQMLPAAVLPAVRR